MELISSNASIGYFGVPGGFGGLTHLSDGKTALCGTRFHPEAVYQWCLPDWRMGDAECNRCKKIRLGWLIDFNEDKKPNIPMKAPSKTNMAVHFSSDSNEWTTPIPLFYWLDRQYHFTLDPCCTHKTAKCTKHFTIKEDGLSKSWGEETVFVNPPYSRGEQAKWIKKAYEESLKGALVVLLVPSRTDTKVWHDYCMKGSIDFIKGRVKFLQGGQVLTSAPFPSALVVFNPYGANSQQMGSFVL